MTDLEPLFERMAPRLFRYASAILGSAADAEEVVQDVLVAYAELKQAPGSPEGWLLKATRNAALKQIEGARRRLGLLRKNVVLLIPREGADPEQAVLAEKASKALALLPVEQREAVALHLFEGLTFKEIAEAAEAPLDTIASRYRYGIDKLREILDEPR